VPRSTWKTSRCGISSRSTNRASAAPGFVRPIASSGWTYPDYGQVGGELWKLGIAVAKSTVEKYCVRHRKPPSPTWKGLLNTYVKDLVALDCFTVPTVTYKVRFVLVILAHERRRIVHINVGVSPPTTF
jgi:hypothetical protein